MRTRYCAIGLALTASSPVVAQGPDTAAIAAERAAIAKLDWMEGVWRGEAVTQFPGGAQRVTQTERMGNMLDGTIKVIEGKGYRADGSVGFNAFAVISYDVANRAYVFRSYAQGRAATLSITPTERGYVWEIPAGPMTIRYTAQLRDGVWNEVGDRVTPGKPPVRFFEMNLRRIGGSDWPAAGGPGPR